MDIWGLCKCTPESLCPFCKALVAAVIAVICGLTVYLVARRRAGRK